MESKDFHNKSSEEDFPFLYCVLKLADEQVMTYLFFYVVWKLIFYTLCFFFPQKFPCPPSIRCSLVVKGDGRLVKLLLRGDANGRVSVFSIPEVTDNQLEQIQQLDFDNPPSNFTIIWWLIIRGISSILEFLIKLWIPSHAVALQMHGTQFIRNPLEY